MCSARSSWSWRPGGASIQGFALDPYFAKSPADVAAYLFSGEEAPDHRLRLRLGPGHHATLLDAGLGYVVGMIAASLVACALVAFRSVEQIVMPLAIVLRSIPRWPSLPCSP